MDYLDKQDIDEMDLLGLLDFVGWKNSYKEMMNAYEDLVAEAEFKRELLKENEQLKYYEERKKANGRI